MTTAQELGMIEKVRLRSVWEHEAENFTPWLAENISLLGDALGMDLEVRAQETAVGIYWLDILAHDRENDRSVVIENQLGVTDHDHLGKLLTYAAGFDANTMVWVAGEFRDEHREALDLLNQRTGEDTQFFGIEMELSKIGDSLPAPNFKLVAIPRKWRNPKQRVGGGQSERYRGFYRELIMRLNETAPGFTDLSSGKVSTRHICSLATAGRNASYAASLPTGNTAWVELILRGDGRKELFSRLKEKKDDVEAKLRNSLLWRDEHYGNSAIILERQYSGLFDAPETREELQDWMVDRLLKFKEVFEPRLEELVD
ncbi:MAG: DUF4268 domain-containing protein [Chloroflexi bacterium]|nr:DUF4268 domain-containing protein [Chloroflexota bacterium]